MEMGYWLMTALTGGLMGTLLLFSLRGRPGSPSSRLMGRLFFAWAALNVGRVLGGPNLSLLGGILTAALGAPGYLAAWAIQAL